MGTAHEPRPRIRPYRESDLAPLARLFTDSVHRIACRYYSPEQLAAWAPFPPDLDLWEARFVGLETWVALREEKIAGFISYESGGHIAFLYVSPDHDRQGVASALYRHAEAALAGLGVSTVQTEASLAARPFFERFGFRVTEEQHVRRNGVSLRRYAMQKELSGSSSLPREVGSEIVGEPGGGVGDGVGELLSGQPQRASEVGPFEDGAIEVRLGEGGVIEDGA